MYIYILFIFIKVCIIFILKYSLHKTKKSFLSFIKSRDGYSDIIIYLADQLEKLENCDFEEKLKFLITENQSLKNELDNHKIGEKLINVIFKKDEKLCSIICKDDDEFKTIEEELYKKNPKYRSLKNIKFYLQNKEINKSENIKKNGIKDNSLIVIIIKDN